MLKVLVANRGEIAIRILRACREMGLPSVAVYTDVDQLALHVRQADEAAPIGDRRNYLDAQVIIQAALRTGANAIHPGYGFLSENADFARRVEAAGLTFIGPRPETLALLGDKLAARQAAHQAGLPVLPGSDTPLPQEVPLEMARSVHYPVLVKAVAGGGGRGIRLALSPKDLAPMISAARQEALAAFGDDTVYLESLVQDARHIEVQILGDGLGHVIDLGERECSIQRRRQKLIEEAPAPLIDEDLRRRLCELARRLGRQLKYRGLGTIEFLLDRLGQYYFIEANPRIQVEHPVTEMVTGLDLVKEQLSLACGEPLRLRQRDVTTRGHAIEARLLAEDCQNGFIPVAGAIQYLKEPGGPGVRVDSALYPGAIITPEYDSMLAKVITWGETRRTAIQRMRCALGEYQVGGIPTDLEFLLQIIDSPEFIAGQFTTTYLETFQPAEAAPENELEREMALAAVLYLQQRTPAGAASAASTGQLNITSQWTNTAWREQMHGSI
jgi:acetyl-CoA carboxylase biotin carboxylase subunit